MRNSIRKGNREIFCDGVNLMIFLCCNLLLDPLLYDGGEYSDFINVCVLFIHQITEIFVWKNPTIFRLLAARIDRRIIWNNIGGFIITLYLQPKNHCSAVLVSS